MNIREIFTSKLEECYDALANGGDISAIGITKIFTSADQLQECLAIIKSEQERIQTGIEDCDVRIKAWQQSKKAWKARQESLLSSLQETLTNLGIKSSTDGTVKVTMTSKKGIEVVSPEELLKPYEAEVEALKAKLPPYVKLNMDLDKTQLTSYLKQDNTLLMTMPEIIHYKESRSVKVS